MKYFTLLVLMLFASNVYAQTVQYFTYNTEHKNYKTASKDSTIVTGRLVSNESRKRDKYPMIGATATFYDKKDSEIILKGNYDEYKYIYIAKSYTKEDGTFEIKLPYGEYAVQFTFIGIEEHFKYVFLNTKTVNLGDIILKFYSSCNFDDEVKVTRIKWRDRKK